MTARARVSLVFAATLVLASCDPQEVVKVDEAASVSTPAVEPYVDSHAGTDLVSGQTIFVPAYSEVLVGPERRLPFTTSLAIHNAARLEPLVVTSIRHYDTDGNLVKEYAEQPLRLPPLATKVILVQRPPAGGGIGANFIVEWAAKKAIYEPVVEAVMVASSGTQGYSLISPGRVVQQDE